MSLDLTRVRTLLKEGNFRVLFLEELGWERHDARLTVHLEGQPWHLQACAQKRGMVAYLCQAPAGVGLPDYAVRRKIEHQVARSVHEHLIVFTDATRTTQVWQWVRRESGKPTACREHHFYSHQTGEALAQKLEAIAFTLDEEETLTLPDVTRRARRGFDVERVTKRFYDQFKKEHAAFLKFITGITERADHEWYASVMLNRLMFVYFIQRKGFLEADTDYLRHRLNRCQQQQGKNTFYSFYRYFLLRLFHEGLGGRTRTAELEQLLGRIPYLNGGLFEPHEIETRYPKIDIPDEAFERIFDYFDQYQWHLDERPLRADNEINPDVLGYIFEKYINQKQMGAYYTKEDITEYISKNTVVPFLVDAARAKCKVAFENPQGPTVWDLLQADPDRYIYPAVRHGADQPLPAEIAAGVHPSTLHQPVGDGPVQTLELRQGWNRPAPAEYALPTETWREVVARRIRYEEVRARLAAGAVRDINDLITLNLDIRQFAQDAIEHCEGPELLRAFWHAIEKVTILDPTCGSGAFLFAALNILEPLYEACLGRMEAFVEDLDRAGAKYRPEKFSDFRKVLARVAAHPNRRYFIFKSIILNNLFGVDIMEEAVEICKLRLFLKLAAQVAPDMTHGNLGIEPLPDIDFNIKAGNTLVGFATYEDAKRAITSKLDFANAMEKIAVKAADLQQAFDAFRERQVEGDGSVPIEHKLEIRKRLTGLEEELHRSLAAEYGVEPAKKDTYAKWLKSHQPFHWFVEFYGIMNGGGFDVIIGNPPYVEMSNVAGQYGLRNLSLVETGNLYSVCIERFSQLLPNKGRIGVIVPISSISTPRMLPLMRNLNRELAPLYLSNFAVRPGKLFVGVDMNLTIVVGEKRSSKSECHLFATTYNRWGEQARQTLFENLIYAGSVLTDSNSAIAKTGSPLTTNILSRIARHGSLARFCSGAHRSDRVFYHSGGRYFRKCIRDQLSNEYKELPVQRGVGDAFVCLLSSSFYYWFWITISDCYHVTKRDINALPVPESAVSDLALHLLAERLLQDLWKNAEKRLRNRADGSQREEINFRVGRSKPILDEIDRVLARHYGFTEEELDFIINYDIKYRMGHDAHSEDE
jgi:hypothetical protein